MIPAGNREPQKLAAPRRLSPWIGNFEANPRMTPDEIDLILPWQ